MATRQAAADGPNSMHSIKYSAGIFADMTVDGPEIGTLVMIVDRAKNLPNRKTMGKQNPYCAARLGKEAKKTEVDKRGGQTPKWDQELRFTVHESPDYQTLKVSVFSEDKRTDLIGEAWVNLLDVVVPGGGKSDVWQGLNCKGKYAGEIRMELTFYDSRPKPEKRRESSAAEDEIRSASGKVKRRPLPGVTPDSIPEAVQIAPLPGRARHGPREIGVPSRANSMPPENLTQQQAPQSGQYGLPNDWSNTNLAYNEPQGYEDSQYSQPDFLPQLPPSSRQRPTTAHQSRPPGPQGPSPVAHHRAQSHSALPHSHSAPMIPTVQSDYHSAQSDYHPGFELHTEAPEPLPDLDYQHQYTRQRRNDAPPGWENPYEDSYAGRQAYVEDEEPAPPPPPMHSISAPVVPQYSPASHSPANRYGSSPHSARHPSVSSASPLQSLERNYGHLQQTPPHAQPARGRSMDEFHTPSPQSRSYDNTPSSLIPGHSPSPVSRSPAARAMSNRHSIAEPYHATPPRPHPLSQEVSRARSPAPFGDLYSTHQQQPEYRSSDALPLFKPRAISPQQQPPAIEPDRRPRSSYNIQFPVRSFESSDQNPLSTSQPQTRALPNRSTPTRKSVSPRPSPVSNVSPGGMPFGPDSFDVHNPSAGTRAAPLGNTHSQASPYHIRQSQGGVSARPEQSGPIVGWDGREIDPSDHLPVDSWAPEPEKKTPTKTYGLGRDRDFGPRTTQPGSGGPGSRNLSRDTVINFRNKSQTQTPPRPQPEPEQPSSHNRLFKKSTPSRSPAAEPLREHANYNPIPDPYAQQDYSRGFHEGSPGIGAGQNSRFDQGGYGSPQGYGAPSLPPKVPMGYGGEDALSREIAGIDLGQPTGSTRRYQSVASHRERDRYY